MSENDDKIKKQLQSKFEELLQGPFENICMSAINDFVKAQVIFSKRAGLSAKIIRYPVGKCCEWCEQLAGTYDAADAPREIYARHDNCTCVVLYKSEKTGKYTDVWSKKEFESEREARIAREKELLSEAKSKDILQSKKIQESLYEEKIKRIREEIIPKQNIDTLVDRQLIHKQGTELFKIRKAELSKKGQFGPSYVTISDNETLDLVKKYSGKGKIKINSKGEWDNTEIIVTNKKTIGVVIDNRNGNSVKTSVFKIHYRANGIHIVPDYPSKAKGS